ncbi:serine/threonine-protein phosphatase [Nonomuraea terrae]|uniref:Serine/threonine protein phosphatase PstP n=1 Tax=Nonomuraea terrae TaxID=2530383 RepID=A0A4R4YA05_9ACTN|nr:protein phosphatase 2C domain-containing protein [Nonomuraea terrae]TDD41335.1 serine/threonine-protein phosphatase [Nonomuraea terrae]
MKHNIRYAAGSDVGRRREQNEDSGYASGRLLVVADGMGGHAAGELASSAAIAVMRELDATLPETGSDLEAALEGAVHEAARRLVELAEIDPARRGMGTTVTAMLWDGYRFALAHLGDSRGYLLRDGALYQMTKDHTLVQSMVDEGRITEDQAAVHPRRSMVLRVLGSEGRAEPDMALREAEPDDRYLLCSDGLTTVLGPEVLHEVLTTVVDPAAAVQRLIDLANEGGSPDNVTVIVADVVAPGAGDVAVYRVGAGI